MVVKLDLEKAYDRLEWDFIRTTLEQFGIPPPLTQVIMACISTLGMLPHSFILLEGLDKEIPSLLISLSSIWSGWAIASLTPWRVALGPL